LLPYSPLARGFLSGDPRGHDRNTERGRTDDYSRQWFGRDDDQHVLEALLKVAAARDVSGATIALAWVLTKSPDASPLIGATSVQQLDVIEQALAIELTNDEIETLETPYVARLNYNH
jgi:aryl-alcohol dehydrogenase-like predicted oxidoreductase